MQMFIVVPDEWDSGEQFAGEVMVPYHVGIPVWRDLAWERGEPAGDVGPAEAATTGSSRKAAA